MADRISPEQRSRNMSRIRSRDMKPEVTVRSLVHGMGYRYRLHGKDLPGKPDLVFRPRRKAIFVHGCFWHQHDDPSCPHGRIPKSNRKYWSPKLKRNVERDAEHLRGLREMGWRILVVWECQMDDLGRLADRLRKFLEE